MFSQFKKAPHLRPYLNIGCLFDIPTGVYHTGIHGESILNGGVSHVTGIAGRGNTFKSTLGHFMLLRVLDRYPSSNGLIYDTENTLTRERLDKLAETTDQLHTLGIGHLEDSQRLFITDQTMMGGETWFSQYRNLLKERRAHPKHYQLTTPFLDPKNTPIQAYVPFMSEVDSFSHFSIETVEDMYSKNDIGDSKLNTEALKGAAAKSQMMVQLPGLTASAGGYIILTAHIGDKHELDQYQTSARKLMFLKGKNVLKRVPENFTFLTSNCWLCSNLTLLLNQRTKGVEFPRHSEDQLKDDTDLMTVTVQNLRAKNGPSGLPVDLVVSQSEGIHPTLSEFYYLKTHQRFGLGGNDKHYYLELCPDIALSRTKIREKIQQHAELKRGLEITSELCQILLLWQDLDPQLKCDAKTLYQALKEKGYDWSILLNTRGFWMFEEDAVNEPRPFLSTMDLLNMRAGRYHPWWYNQLDPSFRSTSAKS
jgi:hypothetical protein